MGRDLGLWRFYTEPAGTAELVKNEGAVRFCRMLFGGIGWGHAPVLVVELAEAAVPPCWVGFFWYCLKRNRKGLVLGLLRGAAGYRVG